MNRSFVNDILHGRTISSFSSPTNKISIISLKHSTFWTDFAKPTGSVCWAAFTQKMSDGLLGSGKLTLIFGISSPVFQRLQLIFNYEPQDLKISWQRLLTVYQYALSPDLCNISLAKTNKTTKNHRNQFHSLLFYEYFFKYINLKILLQWSSQSKKDSNVHSKQQQSLFLGRK